MLEILIGVVLFMLVALAAVPYWRNRRISGVPGAYYLEQKFQALVVDLWRDYKVSSDTAPARYRQDPDKLARVVEQFVGLFHRAIADGYDAEMRLYLDDLCQRQGEQALRHAIAWVVIDFESAGDLLLSRRAFAAFLRLPSAG